MGMSASQMRLLTLTARTSDIELAAQLISNTKMQLARQSEIAATDYAKALQSCQSTSTATKTLSSSNLDAAGYQIRTVGNKADGTTKLGAAVSFSGLSLSNIQSTYLDNPDKFVLVKYGQTEISDSAAKVYLGDIGQEKLFPRDNSFEVAKAMYEQRTADLASKEKPLDMKLKQLDTERQALKSEAEVVKKVSSENVEKTFNMFS